MEPHPALRGEKGRGLPLHTLVKALNHIFKICVTYLIIFIFFINSALVDFNIWLPLLAQLSKSCLTGRGAFK